jgi:voltage-gated potassium channel Kch
MSTKSYSPGLANSPFGSNNANPQSSQYAAISGYSPAELIYIEKQVRRAIFDAAPEEFNSLRLVFEKEAEEKNLPEFEYLEKTFGRTALEATAIVAAQAAVAGVPQTQVIPMTAASVTHITPDLIIVYPNNAKAVIKSIAGLNVTVESQTSDGLPAVAAGDIFAIMSTIQADGMDYFSNYERLETITRYNFIQEFLRAKRWNRMELAMFNNAGRTNYLVSDKEETMRQMRVDLHNAFWNGQRGEFRISNNYVTKAMGGIFPTMQAAGSMNGTTSTAGLKSMFKSFAFKTNFKKEGSTRFIYGTAEILSELSDVFKEPAVRYAPNDTISSMDLEMYKVGQMKFVPVACELFRDQSCFPKDWARRIFVLDQESISPCRMKGIPFMNIGGTLDRGANGTRENFKDWYIEANLSMQFNNPLGSYYINIS